MNDQELIESYLEGDPAARAAVEGSPDLLRQAVEHLRLEAALRVLHESQTTTDWQRQAIMADLRGASDAASVERMQRTIRHPLRWHWLLPLAASLLILLGLGVWILRPAPAILTQTGDTLVLRDGQRARYTTQGGYTFTLAGPADLIVGPTLRLQEGRLTVTADKRPANDPLIVLTPHARGEVLGTRFVMDTTRDATRLTVTEGRVRLVPNGGPPVIVEKGGSTTATVALRDPIRQPFASDSPWNTAIGSQARLEPLPTVKLDRGVHIETREWAVPVYVASQASPLRTLYFRSSGKPAGQVRIDPAVPAFDGNEDKYLALVDERLETVWELGGAARDPNGDYRAGDIYHTELRGSGWGMPGPGHSGASSLGGLIRRGELVRGIPHALAVLVRAGAINRSNQPFEWPATHALSKWNLYGTNGNIRLGSLLALPDEADLSPLTGPEHILAEALQDYGAYVVGTFTSGRKDIIILAEHAADPDLPERVAESLTPYIEQLQRVANNTPDAPAGGGTPRRPPAPSLIVLTP